MVCDSVGCTIRPTPYHCPNARHLPAAIMLLSSCCTFSMPAARTSGVELSALIPCGDSQMEQCAGWVPPPPHTRLKINCTAHNFGVGLIASLPTLWRADVLVVTHGADIINGFGMHAGASVLEVMPVAQFQKGCVWLFTPSSHPLSP